MAGVTLEKGGRVSLNKEAPGLSKIAVGLGWDARVTSGTEFDLDASAFLLNGQNKVRNEKDFIYYFNLTAENSSVVHTGDNRTGDADGDDETIKVDLSKIPADITRIVFTATIYKAEERKQTFGQVRNAYIRLYNEETGEDIAKYDLAEDYSAETAMVMAELYRHNNEWKFKAEGAGYNGGLKQMCTTYGVEVA